MALTEIRIEAASTRDEDLIEEWFWQQSAVSVSTRPPGEPERMITALFQTIDPERCRSGLAAFLDQGGGQPIRAFSTGTVDDRDWQVSWRAGFAPLQVAGFTLIGEWDAPAEPDDKTILIYPGQAFGTGQHETTRLMLTRLSELDLQGRRVMDAGCGTGILAIAAERLGAVAVFGFDADPDCRENMDHHLRINRCRRTELAIGRLEDFDPGPFDVILANITINVLTELWPRLFDLLGEGGRLISSGILAEQRGQAVDALSALGARITASRQEGEWLLIEAVRS